MQNLTKNHFSFVKDFAKANNIDIFPLINAVITGSQEGKVFIDDISKPSLAFVITKFGFSQLFNTQGYIAYKSFVNFIKLSDEIPFYFHIYDAVPDLIQIFENANLGLKIRERKQLRFLHKDILQANNIPAGFTISDIKKVAFDKFDPFKLDLDSRFWSSKNDFSENAYGTCILNKENIPVSLCYSASVADNISEIDVATLPEYQGKGLAKIVTFAYLNESIKRNIKANWDCFAENTPSLKIAIVTGFSLLKTYSFLSVFIKEKQK